MAATVETTTEQPRPARFGWCMDGHCSGCPGSHVAIGGVRQGETVHCGCTCHGAAA